MQMKVLKKEEITRLEGELHSIRKRAWDADKRGEKAIEVRCRFWTDTKLYYIVRQLKKEGYEILPQREVVNDWYGFWVVWHESFFPEMVYE